jgi:predicted O-methyltransferase YrrM
MGPVLPGMPGSVPFREDPALAAVTAVFDEYETVRLVYPRGLLHRGGPHRRLSGMVTPISIGEDECRVLGRVIDRFRPDSALVIGNGFGFSACYIACAMRAYAATRVVAVDDQRAGDGARCTIIAEAVKSRLGLDLLQNLKATSPGDIGRAVNGRVQDLVLIDGGHFHQQPTRDFEGVLPFLSNQTIVVWHDGWLPGVAIGVCAARRRGFRSLWLPTSAEVVLTARDGAMLEALSRDFPAAIADWQPRVGLPWRLAVGVAWWSRLVGVAALERRASGQSPGPTRTKSDLRSIDRRAGLQ